MNREVPLSLVVILLGLITITSAMIGAAFIVGERPDDPPPIVTMASDAVAEVAPPPVQKPAVLLRVKGNGIKSTPKFVAPSEWTMDYSFNCASFGFKGNFQVFIYNADGGLMGVGANELDMRGSDTQYFHQGGNLYLEINSTCSWDVTVKG